MLKKVVALSFSLILFSQTMSWALPQTEEHPVSLTLVQAQARRDASAVNETWKVTTPLIVLIGALTVFSGYSIYQNRALRSKIRHLHHTLDEQVRDKHYYKHESKLKSQSNATLKEQYNTLELQYDNLLESARRDGQTMRIELNQARSEMELLKQTYEAKIAELERGVKTASTYLTNQTQFHPALEADVKRFEPLFDPALPKLQREALREELTKTNWFRSFSPSEQMQFNAMLSSLLHNVHSSNSDFVFRTKSAFDIFMTQQTSKTGKYMFAMLRNILTKRNLLMSGLVVFAAMSASVQQADTQAYQIANRIHQNIDLFLNATAEELSQLESNPVTYQACLQNAAALHELATLDRTVLEEAKQLSSPAPTMQLRSVPAR